MQKTKSVNNARIFYRGKAPEVAGTAINGMLTKLMTADKGGKKFQETLRTMGVDAKQLKKNIAQNAEQALVDFLKQVNKLPKENQMGALVDLFGLEYADDVAILTGSLEQYEDAIRKLKATGANGELSFLGSMGREFDSRMATTAANWQTFKNQLMHVAIVIGTALLPTINDFLNSIKPMIDAVIRWSEAHAGLIKNVFLAAAALVVFKAGFLGMRFAFNLLTTLLLGMGANIAGVFGTWLRFASAFQLLKIGGVSRAVSALQILGLSTRQARQGVVWFGRLMRGLTNGIGRISVLGSRFLIAASRVRGLGTAANWLLGIWRTLSMAALTNPLGLAIAGIAVAAVLIYKYWGPIKSFFIGLWDGFKDGVAPMMPVLEMIAFGWQQIWEVVSGFFSDFMGGSSEASDSAQGFGYIVGHVLGNILSIGFTIVDGWRMIFDVLFGVADSVWTAIKTAFNGGLTGILGLILNWSPIGAFYSAFAAVLSWFGVELPAKFTEFGRMMLDGLINGIKSKIETAVQTVQGLATRLKGAFTSSKSMDIHSPSRVFMRYGGWMMEGLQIGLGNGSARPLAVIGSVASDLQQRFKNRSGTLSAELAASMQADSAEFAAARQAQAGGAVTIHFNPTIHAPGGDVRQIQSALQLGLREFEDLFNRLMDERSRRAY